ncbi:MAG: M48 family metallopeptidase [Bryobacteraceae bacterium]
MYRVFRTVSCLFLVLLGVSVLIGKDKPKDPKHDPGQIGSRDVGKGVNFYSVEREIALGHQMAEEATREAKMVDDSVVSEYINRIGQTLVHNSDATVPFTFRVIDSDEINAFALPGGFMFVNSGLIFKAENEAEFAGVIAHEIGHVAARHGTRQATRGQLINYGSIPLIFMGGWAGYAIRQMATIAVPMGFLKFSRGMEAEADLLGLQYMYKAGYDPTEFVNFFEKIQSLEKKKPGAVSRLFSSHPMTGDRIRAAQKEIQQDFLARPQYVLDTSEFQGVKKRLIMVQNRRVGSAIPSGPMLRTRSSSKVDLGGSPQAPADEDARPTLKRKD